ncbi:hypothetical protein WKH24_06460 [Pantoea agglomerans]|uniref:hypothetical protein n=1 Tax=Enterobacter agglomerans TaxID=549 RepID=UPI003C7B5CD1
MAHITALLNSLKASIPRSEAEAQQFLQQLSIEDQCAIISATYIGAAHLHYDYFIEEGELTNAYFSLDNPYGRFFHTGTPARWFIEPSGFAYILYSKASNLAMYCDAFTRCSVNSGYDLASF